MKCLFFYRGIRKKIEEVHNNQVCSPSGFAAPFVETSIAAKLARFSATAESCGCEAPPLPDSMLGLLQEKRAETLPPRPNIILLISDDVDREVAYFITLI